jgi:outer membrane protein assembly factor BamB
VPQVVASSNQHPTHGRALLPSLLAVTLACAGAAFSADWSEWRGPNRDATGGATSAAPRVWPAELARAWRVPAGSGQSSPVVGADTVFLFAREGEMEVARAFALSTGRSLWRQAYEARYDVYPGAASYGSGPRSTPVLHEGRLFTLGISGILTAFDAGNGRILWQKDFAGRFKEQAPPFGTAMSPLVASGLLIAHVGGHEGGALVAFDPVTGAERWALEGDGPSYSSPILTSFEGQQQIVVQVHRRILGVDPALGRILWSVPFVTPCDQNIVTPLRAGELVVVSSLSNGTQAIRVARRATEWIAEPAWQTQDVSMYMSSPVLLNGRVVGLSHRRRGQYFGLDPATGSVVWRSEAGQGENATFLVAAGALLVLQGDGTLLVLPERAQAFSPTRRYRVADSSTYAHPVPTRLGILVKDEAGLSLYGTSPAAE